jgi:hypothetical protein
MALFQEAIIKKHLNLIDDKIIEQAFSEYKRVYSPDKIKNIRVAKEEQYQEGFIKEIFGSVLGYSVYPESPFNIETEKKNETNARKADGAILSGEKVVGVIELKDNKTKNLDAVKDQAFGYKNNHKDCSYVISSNFHKLRFYIDDATDYEEFDLYNLDKETFKRFYLYLRKEGLLDKNLPKLLRQETKFHEEEISKKLYKDYSNFKRRFFENAVQNNPQHDKLELFKKSQKFLDRILFLLFAEDKGLVGTNSIVSIVEKWSGADDDYYQPLYEMVNKYFGHLYRGYTYQKTGEVIPQFGGELFAPDELLESLKIDDEVLKNDLLILSKYDFNTDVDVNILGHIFEHSLNEVDDVEAELRGETLDKSKSKRKKDGVFYTPKYITKYIVDNTLGKLCTEKKIELKLDEDIAIFEYQKSDGKLNEKGKELFERLNSYKSWLLTLKVCDPACGSGAFLNQALSYFIEEHKFVDDIIAELKNAPLRLFDTDLQILENNIFGVDINEESVEIAKLSMWLRTAQPGRKLSDLSNNIKCGNSLIDDPAVAGDKAFNWEKEFPTVFEKGGFDVVLGNPPYVRMQNIDINSRVYFSHKYTTAYQNYDLYVLFTEKIPALINSNGRAGYIMPKKFITSEYGEPLKKFIYDGKLLESFVDFSDVQIFEDATTYTGMFFFKKGQEAYFDYKKIIEDPQKSLFDNPFLQIKYSNLETKNWIFLNQIESNLFDRLSGFQKLKDTDCSMFVGLQTSADPVYIIEKRGDTFYSNFTKKEYYFKDYEILKPLLKGSEIKRYSTPVVSYYLIFPYQIIDNKLNLIGSDIMSSRFNDVWEYLLECQEKLKGRENGKMDTPLWYGYVYLKNMTEFDKPKIITQVLCKSPSLTIDLNDKYYFVGGGTAGGYGIRLGDQIDQYLLIAILNSRLSHWYIKQFASPFQGGYFAYNKGTLGEIPIPKTTAENRQITNSVCHVSSLNDSLLNRRNKFKQFFKVKIGIELTQKLEKWYELVFTDFIKELNKGIKNLKEPPLSKKDEFEWMELFEENKKKILELKSQIDQTDKEIDRMVYALYGLTEEEIQIVENS